MRKKPNDSIFIGLIPKHLNQTKSVSGSLAPLICICSITVVFTLFSSTLTAEHIPFAEQRVITDNTTSPVQIQSVFAADLDNDGDMDVLSASQGDNKIAWYENDGGFPPVFTSHVITNDALRACCVAAGDLDGDGDEDVVAAAPNDDIVCWFENEDALGTFSSSQIVSSSRPSVTSIHVADIDQDGNNDVLSISREGQRILWHRNAGGTEFTDTVVPSSLLSPSSVASANIDNDVNLEIVCADSLGNSIKWFDLVEDATFTEHTVDDSFLFPEAVFVADLNSDGFLDVLSASNLDNKIAWHENMSGMGDFGPKRIIASDALGASSVFATDLDGDKDMDVISASQLDNTVAWYENNLDGTFTKHIISELADFASSVFAADLDGDGDSDVISGSEGNDKLSWYENDETKTFPERTISYTLTDAPWYVRAADINGDNFPDIFSGTRKDRKLVLFVSDGQTPPTYSPLVVSQDAFKSLGVYATDLDGDGNKDLFSASPWTNEVTWYENLGSSLFGKNVLTSTAEARSVVTGDVDNDGDPDVLAAGSATHSVFWYENLGSHFFPNHLIMGSLQGAVSVDTADFDNDGDLDIVGGADLDDRIEWYENSGSTPPTFMTHLVTQNVDQLIQVLAADVDGDGRTDIISGSHRDDRIHWYKNDGNTPLSFRQILIGDDASGVRGTDYGDIDADGDLDVVAANSAGDEVVWYDNDGNEIFTKRVMSNQGAYQTSVFAIDLDLDGDLDVVSSSLEDDRLAWHENLLIGETSPTPSPTLTGTNPYIPTPTASMSMVDRLDVEEDGRIDVMDLLILIQYWHMEEDLTTSE